jgi:hypothetical protein
MNPPLPHEAPLVHLISIDPTTLSGPELEAHLRALRELRASPQTTRAKTNLTPRKATEHLASAKGFL